MISTRKHQFFIRFPYLVIIWVPSFFSYFSVLTNLSVAAGDSIEDPGSPSAIPFINFFSMNNDAIFARHKQFIMTTPSY